MKTASKRSAKTPTPAKARPPFASVLVALDGSPFTERSLPLACALARVAGARGAVELVHVHATGVHAPNAPALDPAWENERAAEMRADLDALARRASREMAVRVTAVTLRGRVAESIVAHAADIGADLIVMTTHARSGVARALLGSVAEQVLRTASVPVLLVPPADRAADVG